MPVLHELGRQLGCDADHGATVALRRRQADVHALAIPDDRELDLLVGELTDGRRQLLRGHHARAVHRVDHVFDTQAGFLRGIVQQ